MGGLARLLAAGNFPRELCYRRRKFLTGLAAERPLVAGLWASCHGNQQPLHHKQAANVAPVRVFYGFQAIQSLGIM